MTPYLEKKEEEEEEDGEARGEMPHIAQASLKLTVDIRMILNFRPLSLISGAEKVKG